MHLARDCKKECGKEGEQDAHFFPRTQMESIITMTRTNARSSGIVLGGHERQVIKR